MRAEAAAAPILGTALAHFGGIEEIHQKSPLEQVFV
jgi:hypothetical protein